MRNDIVEEINSFFSEDYCRSDGRSRQASAESEAGQEEAMVSNARGYLELLREHISKEDDILYPLAERVIPEEMRDGMVAGYEKAEAQAAEDFEARSRAVVEAYEAKAAA